MSDSRKALAEDEAEYLDNCKYFGEPVHRLYTEHSDLLEKLRASEKELHTQHLRLLRQRRQALAKLTPEDKLALGLKD